MKKKYFPPMEEIKCEKKKGYRLLIQIKKVVAHFI